MALNVDNIVFRIEKKYGVQAIQSEAKNLFYLQDDDREAMGILTIVDYKPTFTVLKKEQIKALINELQDVYEMMFY